MSHHATLDNLRRNDSLDQLKQGSRAHTTIRSLQHLLRDIGYQKELNWDKYGADGFYGNSTTTALRAFLERNDLPGDGTQLTDQAAEKLLLLQHIVDDLCHLQDAVNEDNVEARFRKGSREKMDIVAMQTLLYELGYGEQLKWSRYGADGDYGAACEAAVLAFAADQQLESDGQCLTKAMAERILATYVGGLGDGWFQDPNTQSHLIGKPADAATSSSGAEAAPAAASTAWAAIKARVEGKNNVVTDGQVTAKFRRFRKGNYTYGSEKLADFIQANENLLADFGITKSAMNVMRAVSENEGNLDAINTWDNCYMTFGMFQWTLGPRHGSGELPALLKKIKEAEPEVFNTYYAPYGLDVASDTDSVYGYVTLNGKKINRAEDKEPFRSGEWSFVFWRAGHNDLVKAIEVEHALARLKTFYWRMKINGFAIADIITSEYGVGLILDNHVNRPGYVKSCIRLAMQETGLLDPTSWTTTEERRVIDAYIRIRATYGGSPMTHADKRAAVTKKYVTNGLISEERRSFKYTDVASRSASTVGVAPPLDFRAEDYPIIRGDFIDEYTEY